MIRAFVPIAAAAALAACSTAQIAQVQPLDGVISGQCHTDMVRGAVGLAATAQTVERARVDSDSHTVEVVRGAEAGGNANGSADSAQSSRESGGDRLTIERGQTNDITAIYCG